MKSTCTAKKPSCVKVAAASSASILGNRRPPVPIEQTRPGPRVCYVCLRELTKQRIEALKGLGTPIDSWMCVKCSADVTSPRLGIYMGEVGTSELKIVDKIYNDSVRDIFMQGGDDEEDKD